MIVTDSQVHIWGADAPGRPWPPGRAHMAQKPCPVMGRGIHEWLGRPEVK
jgi:hypothetical protein